MRVIVLALLLGLVASCGEPASPPNVLFVSIDTLRADRLGVYGYERPTTPNLDALAARGVLFDPVIAESSWTIPSHVTMLSGLSARSHGVENPMLEIADETPMLAETLRDAGYRTFAITDGHWLSAEWGFDQGFGTFEAEPRQGLARIVQRAKERIDHAESRDEPWFAFLQTYDTHCPYQAPEAYRRMFRSPDATPFPTDGLCGNPHFNSMELDEGRRRHLVDLYDAGVRWVDDELGAFIDWLDEKGYAEDTLIVVTSDHGEELFEAGRIGHGTTLDPEVLRVPWILVAPDIEPRVVDGPVALADITPTVLDLVNVDLPTNVDGRSWIPALAGVPMNPRGAYSRVRWEANLESWTTEDSHFVRELVTDPQPAKGLDDFLAQPSAARLAAPERPDLSSAEVEALRAIGYLGD